MSISHLNFAGRVAMSLEDDDKINDAKSESLRELLEEDMEVCHLWWEDQRAAFATWLRKPANKHARLEILRGKPLTIYPEYDEVIKGPEQKCECGHRFRGSAEICPCGFGEKEMLEKVVYPRNEEDENDKWPCLQRILEDRGANYAKYRDEVILHKFARSVLEALELFGDFSVEPDATSLKSAIKTKFHPNDSMEEHLFNVVSDARDIYAFIMRKVGVANFIQHDDEILSHDDGNGVMIKKAGGSNGIFALKYPPLCSDCLLCKEACNILSEHANHPCSLICDRPKRARR